MFLDLFEIEALGTHLAGRDVLAILATGFEKSLMFSVLFDIAFAFELECEWISAFAAQQHHRRTSQ